jgi:hypothetical protein
MIRPLAVDQCKGDVGDGFPSALRMEAAPGEQEVQMGIVVAGSTARLQDDDRADVQWNPGASRQDVGQAGVPDLHQGGKQLGMVIEPGVKELGDGQDKMTITDVGKKTSSNEIDPGVGVSLGARETEGRFTTEGNATDGSTVGAAILREAHLFGIAAIEHFLHDLPIIGSIVMRVGGLKCLPVIAEDLLEGILVNMFHSGLGRSLRSSYESDKISVKCSGP